MTTKKPKQCFMVEDLIKPVTSEERFTGFDVYSDAIAHCGLNYNTYKVKSYKAFPIKTGTWVIRTYNHYRSQRAKRG